tara:strand:- start:449 stop:637 length:189 start_codon:yes stop_codon:yes gene_type:complete
MKNRKPLISSRTENFHFSISFDPDTGTPQEFFINGRGKVGQQLDEELRNLSIETCKIMQGEV